MVAYTEDNVIKFKLPDRALGDPAFKLVAYATSGLPVSFVSSDTEVATVVGNLVYLHAVGETTISAIQMGDARYHPASPVGQVLRVIEPIQKDDQNITFEKIDIKATDDPPFRVIASASSDLPVFFKVDYGPATINSSGIIVLNGVAGEVSITAAQTGSAYYNPATPVTRVFEVSPKQRPTIVFPESADHGQLDDMITGHRPLILQGVYATSGEPFIITSSNSTIVEVHQGNQIVPKVEGNVTLYFNVPASENYLKAETQFKILSVVKPTRENWRKVREKDVRFVNVRERFVRRMVLSGVEENYAKKIFNEGYVDSDGDGYSNDFERALGMDSLGSDSPHHLPMQFLGESDERQRISFIRLRDPLGTIGEEFRYVVERSDNLRTWSTTGLSHESSQDLGGGMERVIFVTDDKIQAGEKSFLRLRVEKP